MTAALRRELAREGIAVALSDDGVNLKLSSKDKPDAAIIAKIKAHKSALVAHLQCHAIHADLVERLNAEYQGGPIPWDALEPSEREIDDAFRTNSPEAMRAAVRDYWEIFFERTAIQSDNARGELTGNGNSDGLTSQNQEPFQER